LLLLFFSKKTILQQRGRRLLIPHTPDITITQNGKPRSIPMIWIIKDIIEKRVKKRVVNLTFNTRLNGKRLKEPVTQTLISEYVFHVKGKKVWKFDDVFKEARIKAGLPGKLIHDCRRTASRNLVRAGVPESVAMQITGHKTNSQFKRYNIVDETDKVQALLSLETRFNALKKADEG
jgi:integrase